MGAIAKTRYYIPDELRAFQPISPGEIHKLKRKKRVDTKYITHISKLEILLNQMYSNYYILETDNLREHEYDSLYYDTEDLQMYMKLHNGASNCYKIRKCKCQTQGDIFLEIKRKDNKKVNTKKSKITRHFQTLSLKDNKFIQKNTCYNGFMLKPVLSNSLQRITLINKTHTQRITIDRNISFGYLSDQLSLPEIIVIEIKSLKDDPDRKIIEILQELNIVASGMNKYCIGMAMIVPGIKKNLFKPNIHFINKIQSDGRTYQ